MSRGNRKKSAQAKIAALRIKARNGIVIAVAALVIMAVIIALKLSFEFSGAEWAATPAASMTLFMSAIVATAVAGWGTNTWKKARDKIKELEGKK